MWWVFQYGPSATTDQLLAALTTSKLRATMFDQGNNALADAQGYVKAPDIDLGEQMTQMMAAQRAYQANLATIDRAKDAYQQALELGK